MTRARRVVCASGVLLAMLFCRSSASFVDAAVLSCSGSRTLDALARCIGSQMPQAASSGYFQPSARERAEWRRVVRAMLEGRCDLALPGRLAGVMQVRTVRDGSNGRGYCVFMEVLDADRNGIVDRGWGTFIVDPAGRRELHHHAPHPLSDATTERQALAIFRDTESRGYLMAGAHRNSDSGLSSCQRAYASADVAHNRESMFHATNEELAAFYGDEQWSAIQWHGMAETDCKAVNVYMSHGRDVAPSSADTISQLKERLLEHHPTWKVGVPGDDACSLNGTFNVQGRLLNGVEPSAVCGTAAHEHSGRFLHIEQDPAFRSFADWVEPVANVWR
jgi:hypothetical protein